jgi:Spy/CpxP family protein refolding chaperone
MKHCITLLLALLFTIPTLSQKRDKKNTPQIFKQLNLSATQKEKINKIRKAYQPQFKEIRKLAKNKANKEKMQKLRDKMINELKEVLTAEQFKKYQESMAKQKNKKSKRKR